jgi:hypothetical protein
MCTVRNVTEVTRCSFPVARAFDHAEQRWWRRISAICFGKDIGWCFFAQPSGDRTQR